MSFSSEEHIRLSQVERGEYPKTITLDSDLLFKLARTLRELRQSLPQSTEYALERHDLKREELLFNSLLSNGDLFLSRQLSYRKEQLRLYVKGDSL